MRHAAKIARAPVSRQALKRPLVKVCRNVARVNATINHKAVRPYVGDPDGGRLDASGLLSDRRNVFLMGRHGGFALIWTAPSAFEVHVHVLPDGRGRWARDAALEVIAFAKARGASSLWARTPDKFPHVESFARRQGMIPTGERSVQFGEPYTMLMLPLVEN